MVSRDETEVKKARKQRFVPFSLIEQHWQLNRRALSVIKQPWQIRSLFLIHFAASLAKLSSHLSYSL